MESIYNGSLFTLSGINATAGEKCVYFFLVLFCYVLIVITNLTLIVTICSRKTLHEPMYIFLCNLCVNGLFGTAGFYPKFLSDLLSEVHVISPLGCFLQVFVIYSSVLCDFSTLTVMAFDRFVAICRPLEYHSIMTSWNVGKLITFTWICPFLCKTIVIVFSSNLTLCGSYIDKLYCENWSIVRLSCFSITVNNIIGYAVITVYLGHVFLIIFSYTMLIRIGLSSKENKRKVLQTCTPHLLTLTNIVVATLFDVLYTRYRMKDFSESLRTFLSLEFLILPPLFNPMIYGFKLNKVRQEVLRYWENNVLTF